MMKEETYNKDFDLVIISPDKKVTSFVTIWLDKTNNISILEPLGSHPNYRCRGLSKKVILKGIKRLNKVGISKFFVKKIIKI